MASVELDYLRITSLYNINRNGNVVISGTVVTSSSGQPLVVSATDNDRGANALLSYHIVTDWAREYFTVDYGTGAVRTTRPLDYEKVGYLASDSV